LGSTCICSPLVCASTSANAVKFIENGTCLALTYLGINATATNSSALCGCVPACFLAVGGTALCATTAGNALCLGGNLANTYAPISSPVFTGCVGVGVIPVSVLQTSSGFVKTDTSARNTFFISSCEVAGSNPFGLRFNVIGAAAIGNRCVALQTIEYNVADGGSIILQNAAGNVGIGTTATPYSKLNIQVGGNNTAPTSLLAGRYISIGNLEWTAGAVQGIGFGYITSSTDSSPAYIALVNTSTAGNTFGDLVFFTRNTTGPGDIPPERMRITSAGVVCASGCFVGVDMIATSDCRLKNCIKPIMGALSTVMKLQGICYELCNDELHENQIGLIAQDVQKILPVVVSHSIPDENDAKYGITDDKLGLKYDKLGALLIEAVKTLKKEVDQLKLDLNYMRNYNC
jgi:hypothetical protein